MPDIYISDEPEKEAAREPEMEAKEEMPRYPQKSEPEKEPAPENRHNVKGHSHNPLSAFFHWPDKVNFETQEKEERVVLMLRKHAITNIPWVLIAVVLALAPNLLVFFPLLAFLPANFQVVALLFWYLVVTAFVLESFLTWFFNVYIVTDERVVDIDFYNLIYKEVTDAKLDKIQDVTYTMGGVPRTIFNYGDVLIQTAGAVPSIEFQAVPNPSEVARILQELRTQEEQEQIEGRVR